MARPIALALSCGVVALVVWDKTVTSPEPAPLHSAKEAALADMKSAPVSQLNFASRASGFAALSGAGRSFGSSGEAAGIAGAATEVARRGDTAPRLNEDARDDSRDIPERKEIPRLKVRARGMPTSGSVAIERGSIAVSEEARSAKNEELFNFLESQKKKMGIARVVLKDDVRPSYKAAAVIPKIASPAPVLLNGAVAAQPAEKNRDGNSPAPADKGRLAADAGLVFSDAGSLASSWVLLGFPGQPPAVDFAANRIVLMKPSAAIILSVDVKPNSIDVTFRTLSPEEVSNPVKDRAMVIPREPRAVLLFDVSPR